VDATLGILVGEEARRGKGVGFEVMSHVIEYSFHEFKLNRIKLGVELDCLPEVRFYEKLGFKPENKLSGSSGMIMSLTKC
jgi:RimJ/RimL family protein N-acetyltransferase